MAAARMRGHAQGIDAMMLRRDQQAAIRERCRDPRAAAEVLALVESLLSDLGHRRLVLDQAAGLKQVHRLVTSDHASIQSMFADYLRTGAELLGYDTGILVRSIDHSFHVVAFDAPLGDLRAPQVLAPCHDILRQCLADGTSRAEGPLGTAADGPVIGSCLLTPVWREAEIYGVLAYLSQDERLTCNVLARELIELMAEGIGRDLAWQRVESRLIEARDQAEQAARAKSEFLATISHEIRTPLNGVIGMAELLADTRLDLTQRDYLGTIRTCGEHLQTLLGDILDLSRIEVGQVTFDRVVLDVCDLADEVVGILAPQAHEKGLAIAVGSAPSVPYQIVGDIGRTRQILLNLVGNAIKFTAHGAVYVDLAMPDQETLEIAVTDTGIGIPPARQHQIFEAFCQADSSTTRRFGGTGLGLAICKRLVTLMGGDIYLRSRPGVGSCFRIALPVDWPAQRLPAPRPFAGHTLLVESSDLRVAERLAGRLRSWGALLVDDPHDASAVVVVLAPGEDPPRLYDRPTLLLTPAVLGRPLDAALERLPVRICPPPWRRDAIAAALGDLLTRAARESSSALRTAIDDTLRGCRVLLAEDNPVNRRLAERMLGQFGCVVTAVGNGQEALETLATGTFDLVVMDCQMPVLDGYEATRRIRASDDARARIPILALTAHAMAGDRDRCIDAGMDAYVVKPVRTDDLRSEIAALIASRG